MPLAHSRLPIGVMTASASLKDRYTSHRNFRTPAVTVRLNHDLFQQNVGAAVRNFSFHAPPASRHTVNGDQESVAMRMSLSSRFHPRWPYLETPVHWRRFRLVAGLLELGSIEHAR